LSSARASNPNSGINCSTRITIATPEIKPLSNGYSLVQSFKTLYRRADNVHKSSPQHSCHERDRRGEKSDHTTELRSEYNELFMTQAIFLFPQVLTNGFPYDKGEGSLWKDRETTCFAKDSINERSGDCSKQAINRLNFCKIPIVSWLENREYAA